MTAWLLDLLGKARGSGVAQLAVAILFVGLIAVALVIDAVLWTADALLAGVVTRRAAALCPRSHEVVLWGAWECPSCRLVHEGHGFGRCPHCGERAYALRCPCGLPVVNPLSPRRR